MISVSSSGYHVWLQDRKRRQAVDDARREKIKAVLNEGQGVYGVDRICGVLRCSGDLASYPIVKRIMAQEGLKSCHLRRRQRSLTDSRSAHEDEYKNQTKGLNPVRWRVSSLSDRSAPARPATDRCALRLRRDANQTAEVRVQHGYLRIHVRRFGKAGKQITSGFTG